MTDKVGIKKGQRGDPGGKSITRQKTWIVELVFFDLTGHFILAIATCRFISS